MTAAPHRWFQVGPGCSPVCGQRSGHDARSDERYGRELYRASPADQLTGVSRTGPLSVDFDARRIMVDGCEVTLTVIEEAILTVLAVRAGRACTHEEIVGRVWGAVELGLRTPGHVGRWKSLRTHMSRLRSKLGPAGDLITTLRGRGYRLEMAPDSSGDGGHRE